jgi:hypothetical protein
MELVMVEPARIGGSVCINQLAKNVAPRLRFIGFHDPPPGFSSVEFTRPPIIDEGKRLGNRWPPHLSAGGLLPFVAR